MSDSPKNTGMLLVLSGPSGSGKSSILSAVMQQCPNMCFSVSCTTRAPRPGEKDGHDYYFITRESFDEKVRAGLFLEHAEVHGNCYGTLCSEVEERLRAGRDVVLDIDVQGALQVKKICEKMPFLAKSAEFVFIAPPSLEILEKRLRGRGTETEESLQKRLYNAAGELACIHEYSFLIVNDVLTESIQSFLELYRSLKLSVKRMTRRFV